MRLAAEVEFGIAPLIVRRNLEATKPGSTKSTGLSTFESRDADAKSGPLKA
jgi:hypothetical protein